MRLILASASLRRAELLTLAGFEFEVMPANVDETPRDGESGEAYTLRVSAADPRWLKEIERARGTVLPKLQGLLGAEAVTRISTR
jgi:predicted house-cleaning NTP pyrophosphatase (Maf/HAM1 superfamily)